VRPALSGRASAFGSGFGHFAISAANRHTLWDQRLAPGCGRTAELRRKTSTVEKLATFT
jgi:hypothetical protein